MRHQKYENGELLDLFEEYWKEECLENPRKLSYTGAAAFMQARGYAVDSNYLKHKSAVAERYQAYKKSLPSFSDTDMEKATGQDISSLRLENEVLKGFIKKYFVASVCNALIQRYENIELGQSMREDALDDAITTPETPAQGNETEAMMNMFFGGDT